MLRVEHTHEAQMVDTPGDTLHESGVGHLSPPEKGKRIEESRLSDSLTFSKPYDRLLNAQVEEKQVYNLRHRALYRRFKNVPLGNSNSAIDSALISIL